MAPSLSGAITAPLPSAHRCVIGQARKRHAQLNMTAIYLVPYHSQPGLHLNGAAGQFAVVESAIVGGEWPYDNGDDPSFYVARQGGPLTWGVCRQDLRNEIKIGSIVVFFSFTRKGLKTMYRLSGVATVADRLDRRAVFSDRRLRRHRHLYLNVLVRPQGKGWEYDEGDREQKARHSDWLWRIAVHGKRKEPFQVRHKKIYKTGQLSNNSVRLATNYVVFSTAADETYILPTPPEVAIAASGKHEKWTDDELRALTVALAGATTKNGRDYLRAANPTGRNVHRQIRLDLPPDEALEWRSSLISALRMRNAIPKPHRSVSPAI